MAPNYLVLELEKGSFDYLLGTCLESKKDTAVEQVVDTYQKKGKFDIELVGVIFPARILYVLKEGPEFLDALSLLQHTNDFHNIAFLAGGKTKSQLVSLLDDFVSVCGLEDVGLSDPAKEYMKRFGHDNSNAAQKAISDSTFVQRMISKQKI